MAIEALKPDSLSKMSPMKFRKDIIGKTLMRAMKRFYQMLFLKAARMVELPKGRDQDGQ
jgi:hypothetical protein